MIFRSFSHDPRSGLAGVLARSKTGTGAGDIPVIYRKHAQTDIRTNLGACAIGMMMNSFVSTMQGNGVAAFNSVHLRDGISAFFVCHAPILHLRLRRYLTCEIQTAPLPDSACIRVRSSTVAILEDTDEIFLAHVCRES